MVPPASGVFGHFVIETLVEFVGHSLWHGNRRQDASSVERERFRRVEKRTRGLLAGIRRDLSQEGMETKREFIAFKVCRGSKGALVYTPDDYARLDDQLEVLQNNGYIRKVSGLPFADRYCMTEEFVRLLLGGG